MNDEQARLTAISVFAGEVVLGTANRAERSIVEERLAADPTYQAELKAWERRLAPLSAAIPPAAPSPDLWARIEAETLARLPMVDSKPVAVVAEPSPFSAPSGSAPVIRIDGDVALAARYRLLEKRVTRWRFATVAATAMAAAIAAVAVVRPDLVPALAPTTAAPGGSYVGVVNASGETPPLIVSVDLARGEISVRPLSLAKQAGKDFELWAIPDGAKPVSLGVVADGGRRAIAISARNALTPKGLTLAVSVEPPGGSPTGQPTGAVILTGKLVKAD